MFCASCGASIVDGSRFCQQCGTATGTAAAPTAAATTAAAPQMAPAPYAATMPFAPAAPAPKKTHPLALVAIIVTVVAAVVLGFSLPVAETESSPIAFQVGRAIGMLLFPFIGGMIAFFISRRRGRWNTFAGWFFGLAVIWCTLATIGLSAVHLNQADMHRLALEAGGQQAVVHHGGAQGQVEDLVRDMLRQVMELNTSYKAKIAATDLSALRGVYSAESFSSAEQMQRVVDQLNTAFELDEEQEVALNQILADSEARADRLSVSQANREAFKQGFENGIAKLKPEREKVLNAERVWKDAVLDLYQYALVHREEIKTEGDRIVIEGLLTRTEFNSRFEAAKNADKAFRAAQADFDKFSAQALGNAGLTKADLKGQ